MTGSERRTTQRFSMRLPLTVRWTTGAAVGETSTDEITLAGPVRVRCLGRIQRTEQREEGAVGVVAAIERYEFMRGHEEK